jgi:hypothetical protein
VGARRLLAHFGSVSATFAAGEAKPGNPRHRPRTRRSAGASVSHDVQAVLGVRLGAGSGTTRSDDGDPIGVAMAKGDIHTVRRDG